MDEIRFVAGVIIGRYQEKVEEDRQAALKAHEEAAAKKKAEDEAKKAAEPAKTNGDTEMKDADAETIKPDSVEEPPAAK